MQHRRQLRTVVGMPLLMFLLFLSLDYSTTHCPHSHPCAECSRWKEVGWPHTFHMKENYFPPHRNPAVLSKLWAHILITEKAEIRIRDSSNDSLTKHRFWPLFFPALMIMTLICCEVVVPDTVHTCLHLNRYLLFCSVRQMWFVFCVFCVRFQLCITPLLQLHSPPTIWGPVAGSNIYCTHLSLSLLFSPALYQHIHSQIVTFTLTSSYMYLHIDYTYTLKPQLANGRDIYYK